MEFKISDSKVDNSDNSATVEVWMQGNDFHDLIKGLDWFLDRVNNMDDDVAEIYKAVADNPLR